MLSGRQSGRRWAVAAAIAAGSVAWAPPALADDDPVRVRGGNGWIESEVTDPGRVGKVEQTGTGSAPAKPARTCTTTKGPMVGQIGPNDDVEWGGASRPGPGGWLTRECSDGTVEVAWVSDNPDAPAEPQVTPEELAQRATSRLPLPLPEPSFEPRRASSAGPATLVAIPTWFFLDGWKPVSQRTEAGGVWAEVTAEPVATTWWPGDGSPVVRCEGAGRPWSAADDASQACRYTYTRSSAAQPANTYTARVTVAWRVTWRGSGGQSGALPLMERESTFPVAVAERQTVVTRGGSS